VLERLELKSERGGNKSQKVNGKAKEPTIKKNISNFIKITIMTN